MVSVGLLCTSMCAALRKMLHSQNDNLLNALCFVSFVEQSKAFHPDRHRDDESRRHAELRFPEIQQAHSILSDPLKRRAYDFHGLEGVNYLERDTVMVKYTPDEVQPCYMILLY